MSKLTELLDELCPDGVEFRTLKEVCKEIIVPQRDRPKVFGGEIPWCRIEDIEGQLITGSKLGLGVTKDTIEGMNLRVCPEGTVLATCSASLGVVAIAAQPLVTNQTFIGLVCGEDLLNKYLYYFLFTQERKMKSIASTGTIPYISRKKFERLCVPVPPLEVQQEIVRVLDAFTDLEQSLVSELELRKKQFDFYSDLLMTPKTSNSWVRLGEIATIVRGASPRPIKKFIVEGDVGIPWIKIGDVPDDGKYVSDTAQKITEEGAKKSRRVAPGDFILSNSMSFGRPYISQIHGCIHDGWLAISSFEKTFRSDYLYYLLRSRPVQVEFARRAGAGTVKNLNADIVKSVVVPAPSLDDQDDVVARLDVFSELIQTIEQEINLRRTQYEFYRNELLSFTPKED